MTGILRGPRRAALAVIAAVLAAASAVALAESYRGLYDWARGHGLPGGWAAVWPLMVDTFLVVGELALFVALVDRWPARARIPAWGITIAGLVVSVAGNIGHVHGHDVLVRATAAVPPLAAAAALAVGLGVLKRVVEAHHSAAPVSAPEVLPASAPGRAPVPVLGSAPALNGRVHPKRTPSASRDRTRSAPVTGVDAEREFMTDLASGALPSLRQIRSRLHVGQDRAKSLREHLETLTRT